MVSLCPWTCRCLSLCTCIIYPISLSLTHTHTSVRYQDPRPSSDDSKRSSNRPWAFSKNRPWALFEQAAIRKCHFRVSDEGLLAAPGMSGALVTIRGKSAGKRSVLLS